MRLKSIYASPEEKQLYISNQLLNRGFEANVSSETIIFPVNPSTPTTILESNVNRKSLTISNPSSTEILYVSFGVAAMIGIGTFILPESSQTIFPVSTAFVSVIIGEPTQVSFIEI
jgi:hypothetical protein